MATDVLGAVYAFCGSVLDPAPASIVRGWQNRVALPASSTLAVLTLREAIRHGTNVHTWDATPPTGLDTTISMLTDYAVQVDICGRDEATAQAQAATLLMLTRDARAVTLFAPFGLQPLYADGVKARPFADELNQWRIRYAVTLHLAGWTSRTVHQEAFSRVAAHLENVDVHHPPHPGSR